MRFVIDPDLPMLLPAPALLAASAVMIWRRWRGPWRAAIAVPIVVVVAAIIVMRPFWSDARPAWSGYEALVRYAAVVAIGFFATGCVVLVHGVLRPRRQTPERS